PPVGFSGSSPAASAIAAQVSATPPTTVTVGTPPAPPPSPTLWSRLTSWRDTLRKPATPVPAKVPAQNVQAPAQPRLLAAPAPGAASGGSVVSVADQPATAAKRLPPTELSPAQLKKAVEGACGGLAREVKVTTEADRTLTVRVVGRGSVTD